jgi:5-methylcytosine-specific restriction protein A
MFNVNQTYTKKQIYSLLDVPAAQQGGNWDTGYREYDGNFYLFVNVGIPGRTGHNYSNYWDGDLLNWEGKSKSHIGQPQIKKMLSNAQEGTVSVFTRVHDTDPFTYEGKAAVFKHFDTQPVKIIWTFDNLANINNIVSAIPGQVIPGSLWEGATNKVLVNKYERNPWARRECITHYGITCQVCEMDFESRYGDMGKDFIHVHHLIPLSSIKEEYEVDPVNDLIPVCPNCHSMLHKKNPAYTIAELKKLLRL